MPSDQLPAQRPIRIAIVGTGTDVGKTHLSVALLRALARQGQSAVGLKPVESGVGTGESDSSKLAAAGTFHVKHPAPYRFPDPVSPHLAARRVGVAIDPSRILEWVDRCATSWTLIETAGGLLSPLARSFTNLDLVRLLNPDAVVLVGVDRLGVLHDIAACRFVLSAKAPTRGELHVVLQSPALPDTSTGANAEELRFLGLAGEVTMVPRGAVMEPAVEDAAMALLARIQRAVGARCFT
ncbi:MAG: dethiobiotin synthase [Byssovorax sp.]